MMEQTNEYKVGQICEKLSGKEKGNICIVVKIEDKNFVLIDGNVKRRKCNVSHLKPLSKVIDIKEGEKTEKIKDLMKKEGFEVFDKKVKVKERLRIKREAKKGK